MIHSSHAFLDPGRGETHVRRVPNAGKRPLPEPDSKLIDPLLIPYQSRDAVCVRTAALRQKLPFAGSKSNFRLIPETGLNSAIAACPKCVESRCDAVALGSNISVAAPFVRRCLTGSTVAPFSHPPGHRRRSPAPGSHRTWRAALPHHALRQLVHSTASACSFP
jgi:hypothetical protein